MLPPSGSAAWSCTTSSPARATRSTQVGLGPPAPAHPLSAQLCHRYRVDFPLCLSASSARGVAEGLRRLSDVVWGCRMPGVALAAGVAATAPGRGPAGLVRQRAGRLRGQQARAARPEVCPGVPPPRPLPHRCACSDPAVLLLHNHPGATAGLPQIAHDSLLSASNLASRSTERSHVLLGLRGGDGSAEQGAGLCTQVDRTCRC